MFGKRNKKGQVGGILQTVLGVGILVVAVVLIYVFGGAIAGQAYQTVESDISAITNDTIKGAVNDGIAESFDAYAKGASYTPLFILAILMLVFLAVFGNLGGGMGGRSVL